MKPSSHIVFWFLNFHFITSSFSFVVNTSATLCSYDQRRALMDFKNNFTINSNASVYSYFAFCSSSHPKTNSWHELQDCCYWDGVQCDATTGQVIGLDLSCSWLQGQLSSKSSLFLLHDLQILNLSHNNFTGSHIHPKFSQLQRLTHLNLSRSYFSGDVPIEISYLSNLVSLDLSSFASFDRSGLRFTRGTMTSLVQNLTMLKELNLQRVDVSTVEPDSLQNISSTLTSLTLSGLNGIFPTNIFYLPNLQLLNLYGDTISSGSKDLQVFLPTSNWSTTSLTKLQFGELNLKNGLPSSIGNLKSLKFLSIDFCNISGPIPDSIGNLTNLEYLYLDGNYLLGTIPPSIAYLTHLGYLDLSYNNLVGTIPLFLAYLTRLQHLNLSFNKLVGSIPNFSNLSLLHEVYLGWNSLTGTIPFYLYSLPLLRNLQLSYNQFTRSHLHPFQSGVVESIMLANCSLQGPIPAIFFPHGADQLDYVDMSLNSLNGTIPSSLSTLSSTSLYYLSLAHNSFTGVYKFPSKILQFIDLRSNLLRGPLPIPPSTVVSYFISNNSLTGDISTLICNMNSMEAFDLSKNYFTGTIPECLGNITSLSVLDLSMNKLQGRIPNFSGHKERSLRTLNLNGNQLEGKLPISLVNCKNLEVLDISKNAINDTFPHWLRFMKELRVLNLKSNNFHGYIRDYKYQHNFQKLRIFDISNNYFVGPLPTKYIRGLKAMKEDMQVGTNYLMYMESYYGGLFYQDSVSLTIKGSEITLEKILLKLMTIDFSKNKFGGEIPHVIGTLTYLKSLNFSDNNIVGHIPSSIKNLRNLESLDLSSNKLEGTIPTELASLTFLGKLNLSQNALVGPIPSTNNFDTKFDNRSYQGNLELCGPPLSKKCDTEKPPPILHEEDDSNDDDFDKKIILYGYVFGLVIGLSIGYVVFSGELPIWLVKKVQKLRGRTQPPRGTSS